MSTLSSEEQNAARLFGYSPSSWSSLSARDKELLYLIRPLPKSAYKINVQLSRLEGFLAEAERDAKAMGGEFSLTPDFQRGHVWDQARQTAYVENFLRGQAPALFKFNSPGIGSISREIQGDLGTHDMVCVDGLQRLTALREFMANRLPVFGGLTAKDLDDTVFATNRINQTFEVEVFAFPWKHELLDYYVSLNAGGVVHSEEEIARVKAMSEEAKLSATAATQAPAKRRPRNAG